MSTVHVSVPASSANLGPGFDCLALALDLRLELAVEPAGSGLQLEISGEGANRLPHDETNLIFQALRAVCQEFEREVPDLHITCRNQIPVKSGLGSSSAALVAGALAGFGLLSIDPDPGYVFQLARRLEGHADNAAASMLGGLVAIGPDSEWLGLPLEPVGLLVVLPEVDISTQEMRAALPDMIEHAAASRSLARMPFLLEAFRSGDVTVLRRAGQDELHEPHRLVRIPGAASAREAGLSAGAAAVVLSGAGPALLAFVEDETREGAAEAMLRAFGAAGVSGRVFHLKPDFQGAVLSQIEP